MPTKRLAIRLLRRRTPAIIQRRILLIRGDRVLLDSDLAELYGVPTKALNQAVTRNRRRFPADFMFRLTAAETAILRSQSVTSSAPHGGRRYRPRCFTEQGVAMLSSVLHSPRAIAVNIAVMRAFVRLRELAAAHRDLEERIEELERKYDGQFAVVFDAIKQLIADLEPPDPPVRAIGFLSGS